MAIASDLAQARRDRPGDVRPGWATHAAAASALVFTAWEFSSPGARLWMWLILLVVWGGLAAYWLIGFPAVLVQQRAFPTRRAWLHWLVIPALAASAVAFWYSSAPLYARFALSRPAMDDLAAEILASGQASVPNQRLGLYRAEGIERIGSAVRFHVAPSGFGNKTGFAYSPAQQPPRLGEDTYTHLEGPWYVWEESW